jgi:glutaminyl-peptide cyclotransferase
VKEPEFDGLNAMVLLKELVSFGPRSSGTEANRRQAEFIADTARKYGAEVLTQEFEQLTVKGKLRFTNVEAVLRGNKSDFIIIGSHFDSKEMPPGIEFQAANDGASSTAVLLEMIKAVTASKETPEYTLKFVFFDGEECINKYGPNDGLFGSRYYAEKMKAERLVEKCRAVIVLDMVGDKELGITLPKNSDSGLLKQLLAAADKMGNSEYFGVFHSDILDDHVPFMDMGIPAIDIIDFDFGPGNSFWHTSEDNIGNVSSKSLGIVGQTTLNLLFNGDFSKK